MKIVLALRNLIINQSINQSMESHSLVGEANDVRKKKYIQEPWKDRKINEFYSIWDRLSGCLKKYLGEGNSWVYS